MAQQNNYEQVDARSAKAPFLKSLSARKLARHLAAPWQTEEEKVRAFHIWITAHIRYDVKRFVKGSFRSLKPNTVLCKRKALCLDYAQLFAQMCAYEGIEATVVTGYSKGAGYEPDDLFYTGDHAWNAVRVNGTWQLTDLTFASGYMYKKVTFCARIKRVFIHTNFPKTKTAFRKKRNDLYFLTPPQKLIHDHLPSNPIWQLLSPPVPVSVFEKTHDSIRVFVSNARVSDADVAAFMSPDTDHALQLITQADSTLAFNCHNSFQAGLWYCDAGNALLAKAEGGSDNDLLKKSITCFDTAQKMLQHGKEMLREDAYYKNNKNRQRYNLARDYIKDAGRQNKRFENVVKTISNKNKARVSGFERQNKYLAEEVELLSEKNIDAVAAKKKASTRKELEYNIYFKEMVKQNTDSLMRLSRENLLMYERISKNLSDSLLQILQFISFRHDSSSAFSYALCQKRIAELDNLDSPVFALCLERRNQLQLLDSQMQQRTQTLQQLSAIQDEMRKRVVSMKKFARESARFLREIKMRSDLPGKEDSLYRAQFSQIAKELMVIYQKNEVVSAYLQQEASWSETMAKACENMNKLLAIEKMAEQNRFTNRARYISGFYRTRAAVASERKKNASAGKTEARKKMREKTND